MDSELSGFTMGYTNEWWKWTALFQINSGFSFVDLGSDNWSVVKTLEGDVIEFFRVKSYEPSIIPILPDLQTCIDRLKYYQKEYESSRIFPIRRFVTDNNIDQDMKLYDTEYTNYRNVLIKLRKEINCPIEIKTHTLRHTFGMKAINIYKFSTDDVALMMGHEDPRTTRDNYAAVNRDRILEEAQKVKRNTGS
ncbi:MAG: tyrosine-type recombinase/integrase [Bacteroidota bacterium]